MKKLLTTLALCILVVSLNAQETKVTRKFDRFTGIDVSGAVEVFLRLGDNHEVIVVTDKDFQEKVELDVEGGILDVEIDGPNWGNTPNVKLYITVVELRDIEMSGACVFKGKNTIRGNYLNIDLTGASDLELIAEVGLLGVDATGASSIKLAGKTDKMTVDCTGASEVSAYDLHANNASIEMSGASSGRFSVEQTLSIELSGASDVNLKGSPEVKYKEISGAAEFSMK